MVFLLEEIIVEAAMVIATVVATACLLVVLAGFALQRRAERNGARAAAPATRGTLVAERGVRPMSASTPSHH
jgi:archaellin